MSFSSSDALLNLALILSALFSEELLRRKGLFDKLFGGNNFIERIEAGAKAIFWVTIVTLITVFVIFLSNRIGVIVFPLR